MKHDHGITVSVVSASGQRLAEHANAFEERHEDFDGAFGSRLISGTPGSAIEIVVTIEEHFNFYSASGICIAIDCGIRTDNPSRAHGLQNFWLDRNAIAARQTHRFFEFTYWDSEHATPVEPKKAKADWMVDESASCNEGCIAIWITRGKLEGWDDSDRGYQWSPSDPPRETRFHHTGMPKIVRGEWVRSLASNNGLSYVFEYRNMDPYNTHIRSGKIATEGINRAAYDISDWLASDSSESEIGDDSAEDDYSEALLSQPREPAVYQSTLSGLSNRLSPTPPFSVGRNLAREARSRIVVLSYRVGRQPRFRHCDDKDDEEPLPIPRQRDTKRETVTKPVIAVKQESTPPLPTATSVSRNRAPPSARQKPANRSRPSTASSRTVVDLTEDDQAATSMKIEMTDDAIAPAANTRPIGSVQNTEDNDEEALERQLGIARFELRLYELKKKRQLNASQSSG